MAGINLALQVSRSAANFELKLFEKAETSGGNWLWNQYVFLMPDCASTQVNGWIGTQVWLVITRYTQQS